MVKDRSSLRNVAPVLAIGALFSFSAFQGALLGVVQGLAEFLPISSSAHLVLVRWALGWSEFVGGPAVEKAFDVMLHAGTFVALVAYFWDELNALLASIITPSGDPVKRKLFGFLILSTIPGALFGVLFEKAAEERFSEPAPIAVFLFGLAVVLFLAEKLSAHKRTVEQITLADACLIGVAQAFALLPGVSRSGITMSAALFLGFTREASARYSFLMSIPIIGGAVIWEGHKLLKMHLPAAELLPFGWGFLASTIVGYLCIRYLMRYLAHGSFMPFVIYRIALACMVIAALPAHK